MILVFGGTTEGKKTAALLQSKAVPFVYSTKTKIAFETSAVAKYRHGALDEDALINYVKSHQINGIIDAAHPFAEILHETIAKAATACNVPVMRFERARIPKTDHPLVSYINSYSEALDILQEGDHLLALTGVQSIAKLKAFWQYNPAYFRILDRPESKAIADASNFPTDQLILGMPSANLEEEVTLIQKHHINIILTKETGASGFLTTKIEVALQTKARIFIIEKPTTPPSFTQVFSEDALLEQLQELTLLSNAKTQQAWD